MRILMIKLSPIEAITSSMFRTLSIARGLSEQGHEVDFVTIPYNEIHALADKHDFLKKINIIRTSSNKTFEAVSAVSRNDKSNLLKKGVVSVMRKTWHVFNVYDNTIKIAKNISIDLLPTNQYDIVISSSDPKSSHVAMRKLIEQGLQYGRWIQYWGDPLALDITGKSIYPVWVLKRIESKLLAGADKVIYVSPFTLKEQKRLLKEYADKMEFLPIAYMEEKIYPETSNDRFVIGYYGDYMKGVRNLLPFYQACKEFGDKVHVDIIGNSDLKLESDDNIKIYPRGSIDAFERNADLVVCVLNSSGTQIPGKIYHEAGTNKNILVIVDGDRTDEMKEYLRSFGRYDICDNNTGSIKNAIMKIQKERKKAQPLKRIHYVSIAREFIK